MNKKIKISILITLVILLIISLLVVAIPKIVKAYSYTLESNKVLTGGYTNKECTTHATIRDLVQNKSIYIGGWQIFVDNFVYCIQNAQDVATKGSKYNLTATYEIRDNKIIITYPNGSSRTVTDKNSVGFAKGLGFLLANSNSGVRENYGGAGGTYDGLLRWDPVQQALWHYLYLYGEESSSLGLFYKNSDWKLDRMETNYDKTVAQNIFNTASDIRSKAIKGQFESNENVRFYKMENNNDGQAFIIIDKVQITSYINLYIKKSDFSGNKFLEGATITVEPGFGVDKILTPETTSNKNGAFGVIKIIPKINTDNNIMFAIKIKEKNAPNGYRKLPEEGITLNFLYNYETGEVSNGVLPKIGDNFRNPEEAYGEFLAEIIVNNKTYEQAVETILKKYNISENPLKYLKFNTKDDDRWSIMTEIILKNEKHPDVKLDFRKVDQAGKPVKGAKFTLTAGDNVAKISKTVITSDANGDFEDITITPKENTGTFRIKVKEQAPSGYMGFAGEIELEVKYNTDTGAVTSIKRISGEDCITTSNGTIGIVKVENKKIPKIDLRLRKLEENNVPVEGAKFQVVYTQDGKVLDTREAISKINDKGSAIVDFNPDVQPKTDSDVIATIKEIEAPNGYKLLEEEIVLKFTYTINKDGIATWVATEEKDPEEKVEIVQQDQNSDNSAVLIVADVVNKSVIEKLTLLKTDSQDNAKVQGARFKITFNNVESIKGYENIKEGSSITVSTDANGQIILEDVVIADATKDIVITMEEIEAPVGYKKIDGKITLTLHRNGNDYTVAKTEASDTISSNEFIPGNITVTNNEITLNIKDIPMMNIGGIAWQDEQEGIKDPKPADGIYNEKSEKGLAGIKVELYKNGQLVEKDIYGRDLMKKTSGNGQYESIEYTDNTGNVNTQTLREGEYIFPNLERGTDYTVRFTYDGINYRTVQISGKPYSNDNGSKVNEINRKEFNERFLTISEGQSNDGTPLQYKYENQTSDLLVEIDGTNPASTEKTFEMRAQSNTYLEKEEDWKGTWKTENGKAVINTDHYALDINCGLKYKFFDLKLETDIKNARLEIKDRPPVEYDYAKLVDEGLVMGGNAEDVVRANLYLYTSDYNYRIDDYKFTENGAINNQVNPNDGDGINRNDTNALKELEAYLTYTVLLENQSTYNATVSEFEYYYDEVLEPVNVTSNDRYDVTIDYNNRKITFKSKGEGLNVNEKADDNDPDNDYRAIVDIEFRVLKDGDGYIKLTENAINIAQINEYTTQYATDENVRGGLIDNDSAPGNAEIDGEKIVNYDEDDSDQTTPLKIALKEEERKITGKVFEDLKEGDTNIGDGKIQEGENGVNDVIVQLVEIVTTDNGVHEYIWQETQAGGNTVKTTPKNYKGMENNTKTSYSVTNGEGEYQFTDFIPGNYIIRYIYGDGTVYNLTPSMTRYNGQDYKSAINANYMDVNYDASKYAKEASKARDNGARRLEVMAYSTEIDGPLGTALDTFAKNTAWDKLTKQEKENIKNYYKQLQEISKNDSMEAKEIKYIFGNDVATKEFNEEETYNTIKKFVSYKTWMAAETPILDISIDNITQSKESVPENRVTFDNMYFGLTLRPQTKLELEKHITSLKVAPNGVGTQPIVEAEANIDQIMNNNIIEVTGTKDGLSTIKSTRTGRGFWKVESAQLENMTQTATVEVEYTYVIKNVSDEDYLSDTLAEQYNMYYGDGTKPEGYDTYGDILKEDANQINNVRKDEQARLGLCKLYLGEFYYTGNKEGTPVLSRVNKIEEALNKKMGYVENQEGITVNEDFEVTNRDVTKPYYDNSGNLGEKEITEVVQTKNPSPLLERNTYDASNTLKLSSTTASISEGEPGVTLHSYIAQVMSYSNAAGRRDMQSEPENLSYVHSDDTRMTLNSYIEPTDTNLDKIWTANMQIYITITPKMAGGTIDVAEVKQQHPTFSDDDISAIVDKLNTADKTNWDAGEILVVDITSDETPVIDFEKYIQLNEPDEFWGEAIMLSKPTGADKITPIQITIIAVSSVAVIGVGIILIKKFVLKK